MVRLQGGRDPEVGKKFSRLPRIFRKYQVGVCQHFQGPVSNILQITDGSRDQDKLTHCQEIYVLQYPEAG